MAADSTLHDDVRSHIATGDVLVVVGAGESMGATRGNPIASWTGLLKNGAERCREVCSLSDDWLKKKQADLASGDMDDLLAVAEIVASKLGSPAGGEYRRWLRETVGKLRATSRDVLEALRDLQVPIATTNYDGLLEEVIGRPAVTWQDGAKVERVIRGDDQGVLHLHGFWDRPETVILGIRDYEKILGDTHAQTMQKAIRATRTLLFVGCGEGLRDPNFGAFLRWTQQVFSESEYRHFRLARDSEVAALQALHPPAERLFVLAYGPAHQDLGPFLRRLAPTGAPLAAVPSPPGASRLPAVGYCFGRDDLVGDLVATMLQDDPPPTAILGGPGHGKTTVSIKALHDPRVAERFGARRFFVRCEGAKARDALAGEIALAMGLEPGPKLEERAFAELERGRAALVLDNAETPWESDPLATEGLLAQLAAIRGLCLVVSVRGQQRPQGVAWREPVAVPPLDLPAARQAFLAVAGQRFCSDPRLDDLVNVVDRVPLAIALLSYLAEGQPNLDGLWARWQTERTKMLQRAGGADRLNNLELSLDLSIRGPRMNDVARALLSLLGLLPDGIAWQDLDALLPGQGALAAADLRRVGLALDDEKNARLRLLAPVREFVHHHLVSGEANLARAVDHYLLLAAVLGNKLGFEGGAEAATRLAPEINNLESMILIALNRPELDQSVRSACALAKLIRFTGLGTPLALEKIRDAAGSRNDADAEAKCAESLGDIALARSDHDQARERYEDALPLYRRVGSVLGEANCIRSLGDIALARSDHDQARERYEVALKLYGRIPEPYSMGWTLVRLARIAADENRRHDDVQAAREAWTSIKRRDLVESLDREFGSSETAGLEQ